LPINLSLCTVTGSFVLNSRSSTLYLDTTSQYQRR